MPVIVRPDPLGHANWYATISDFEKIFLEIHLSITGILQGTLVDMTSWISGFQIKCLAMACAALRAPSQGISG